MLLYAKYLALLDKEFNFKERIKRIDAITIKDVLDVIDRSFGVGEIATATVGSKKTPLKM